MSATAHGHLITRPAHRDELTGVAHLASRSFQDNELWGWIVPDAPTRSRLLPIMFLTSVVDVHDRDGMVLLAEVSDGEHPQAAAVWAAPGQWRPRRWRGVLAGPRMLRAAKMSALQMVGRRGPGVDRALNAVHPRVPHWYLGLLAVDPAAQGSGLGSAVVRAGLEYADADGLPAYLECEQHLVPYYKRFGFSVLHRIDLGLDAPGHYGMWRAAPH